MVGSEVQRHPHPLTSWPFLRLCAPPATQTVLSGEDTVSCSPRSKSAPRKPPLVIGRDWHTCPPLTSHWQEEWDHQGGLRLIRVRQPRSVSTRGTGTLGSTPQVRSGWTGRGDRPHMAGGA